MPERPALFAVRRVFVQVRNKAYTIAFIAMETGFMYAKAGLLSRGVCGAMQQRGERSCVVCRLCPRWRPWGRWPGWVGEGRRGGARAIVSRAQPAGPGA